MIILKCSTISLGLKQILLCMPRLKCLCGFCCVTRLWKKKKESKLKNFCKKLLWMTVKDLEIFLQSFRNPSTKKIPNLSHKPFAYSCKARTKGSIRNWNHSAALFIWADQASCIAFCSAMAAAAAGSCTTALGLVSIRAVLFTGWLAIITAHFKLNNYCSIFYDLAHFICYYKNRTYMC